eukprot:scaffold1939_cov392-Prasinococcus_capsulatus_cf.AAC.8
MIRDLALVRARKGSAESCPKASGAAGTRPSLTVHHPGEDTRRHATETATWKASTGSTFAGSSPTAGGQEPQVVPGTLKLTWLVWVTSFGQA